MSPKLVLKSQKLVFMSQKLVPRLGGLGNAIKLVLEGFCEIARKE